jgi:hypothetical protein
MILQEICDFLLLYLIIFVFKNNSHLYAIDQDIHMIYGMNATNQIEMVQHRAARFILNQHSWQDSITDMIQSLKLDTLQSRRKNARLCLFFKIDKHLTPLITPEELRAKPEQRRTDNG